MKKWIAKETEFLIDNYKIYGLTYCSTKLNRNKNSVNCKAIKLNLCREQRKKWTQEDIDFLISNHKNKSVKEISKILNRSEGTIGWKASNLNLSKTTNWLNEEKKFLVSNYQKMGLSYCSIKLNKTKVSIKHMGARLGLCKKNKKWSEEEIEILKKNYPIGGIRLCKLNRNIQDIRNKISDLKIPPFRANNIKNRLLHGTKSFECKKHGKVDFYVQSNWCKTPVCKLCNRENNRKYYHKNSKSFLFVYQMRIRNSIREGFNRVSSGHIPKGSFRYLNYTPLELYNYLENIRKQQNNCCPMCQVSYDIKPFDIDHIIPMRTAKTFEQVKELSVLNNLSLLCFSCNRWVKGGKYNAPIL